MPDRNEQYHATMASAPRRQVLDALVRSPEPLDATTVADLLGLHVTTARFHLEQLAGAGLARRAPGAENRRGRPRMLYSPVGAARDDDARDQLIQVLATALAREEDRSPASVTAGRQWGGSFPMPVPDDPIPGLVEVLDQLGFDPQRAERQIHLLACPFRDAAREHPAVVCSVHQGLIERLLDSTVERGRLLPFVQPELCVIDLEPASA